MKKYVTDIKNRLYLKESTIKEKKLVNKISNPIKINTNEEVTNFFGFGSAITESSGYNYQKLSDVSKNNFLNDYFSKNGLNYFYARISIGSNDFSLKSFQYSREKDLSDFTIQKDLEYVVPFLKEILSKKKISLIASPWSAPRMYKSLPILRWGIKLSKKYYDNYCNYLIKYLEEYQKIGINIDYLTMQNEPMARQRWESCVFSLSEQKEFIYNYLLPKLKNTKLLLWDHNKEDLFNIVNYLYQDNSKIAGTCFHYYTGHCFNEIKNIRSNYPNMLLINSEMCTGYAPYNELKWISDAEYYLRDIIGDMNSGINAYLDWNILLDEFGGPGHSKNYVKSASILIDDNYVKSPIYYYLYQISHFLSGNDVILSNSSFSKDLKVVSLKKNNKLIVVIMNDSNKNIEYNLVFNDKYHHDVINNHSIIKSMLSSFAMIFL